MLYALERARVSLTVGSLVHYVSSNGRGVETRPTINDQDSLFSLLSFCSKSYIESIVSQDQLEIPQGRYACQSRALVSGTAEFNPTATKTLPSASTSLFLQLDLPILDQIASYLDFNSALNLSTVCKKVINAAERELWSRVDMEQPLKR